MSKIKVIGITGARRAGKDTFCKLLSQVHSNTFGYAFADALKGDLKDLFYKQFEVDIFSLEGEKKEILRPILIAYGCVWRDLDKLHWVKRVTDSIANDMICDAPNAIYCVTDVRFKNEAEYLKEIYGDSFILVSITRVDGPEPTDEEKRNMPELESLIDHRIVWDTDPSLSKAKSIVQDFYNTYLQ